MNSILIQCDFDNTLTEGNVSELIHEEFGPLNWGEIHSNYKNKLISVEESNIYSFKYLNISNSRLDEFVKSNVKFRPGFFEFYNYILENNINFKIVSSGVDFYIYSALSMLGIDISNVGIYSGKSTFNNEGIKIQYFDFDNKEINDNFKYTYTNLHRSKYEKIIYFGDSHTDLKSSQICDVVFATDKLSKFYIENKLPYFHFNNFFDVLKIFKDQDLTTPIIP